MMARRSSSATRACGFCIRRGTRPRAFRLVVTDLRRGPAPWFVITGDTLFSGAVGRPDLPGEARENASRLYASLHEKLLTLPDDLELYPAHFGGSACGAGLSGKPSSTIGFEKRFNRVLSLEREEFVDTIAVVAAEAGRLRGGARVQSGSRAG